ncbi:dephospho-CoA kinase [Shewanella sp. 202IG2-18]|uniref:dephospho-CoA kinase n=1 Tax=Parashewanella hymeniacidonis TaxID=2807618 RepID=UPI001960A280|nr:dephospho-CoA kinase [Parashewanella hymeniacidonis]MBM7071134.1 dephospho-CoA kinase [Parashewanella hymeniacidonis]
MDKFVVGLTGGIGSGKTTVANLFAAQGIELVDADIVAREVVAIGSEGLNEIAAHFGESILLENGELNRASLREKVFSNEDQRQWLNQCLHPKIRSRMLQLINSSSSEYTVLVVPLLFENGLDKLVNRTLVVDISNELQIKRTSKRDAVSKAQIQSIIDSQMSRKDKLSKANDVICNQGEITDLEQAVIALHEKYLTLIRKAKD